MARKWSIFFYRVKSLLKQVVRTRARGKGRITFIILALLGFISTQAVPAMSGQRQDVMPDRPLGKTFQISQRSNALQLAQEGLQLYQAGQIESAIERWEKAAEIYDEMGDRSEATEILLNKAAAEQGLGHYPRSYKTIVRAMGLTSEIDEISNVLEKKPEDLDAQGKLRGAIAQMPAATERERLNKARGLRLLGEYFQQTGKLEVSSLVLLESIEVARVSGEKAEASAALVSLGNTERAIGNKKRKNALEIVRFRQGSVSAAMEEYQPAIGFYEEAARVASGPMTKIQAQLNHLSLLQDIGEIWEKEIADLIKDRDEIAKLSNPEEIIRKSNELRSRLNGKISEDGEILSREIESQLGNLPSSRAAIYGRIKLAQSLKALQEETPTIAQLLATAAKEAEDIGDPKAQSYALGNLGTLYEEKKRWAEAEGVTSSALSLASASVAPEIAYQWQWQLGRIFARTGERKEAIAAYDAAFNTLKSLQKDLTASDRNIKFSFRDSIAPLYRQYVSLLLRSQASQKDLEKAREVLEQLQIAELDDFFGGPCSKVDREIKIDEIDDPAAIIYPIILEDSLEVILKLPKQKLRHYSTPISRENLEAIVDELHSEITSEPTESQSPDYLSAAQQLYDWLIGPGNLDSSEVETLVFVLDGPLRKIPMAVLHDGQKYLIEKYNLALTLGLKLTSAEPLPPGKIKVLAAGVTKSFPEPFFFDEILAVNKELDKIKETFKKDAEVLREEGFTQTKLQEQLEKSKFNLLHLATHGKFSSNEDDTFIVTGDKPGQERINIDQLRNLLKVKGQSPAIELLVLSACETAEGDDRAVLGLAGVAVRAGARSTIATLWGAHDRATAELMGNQFYPRLKNPGSKAQALREAQLALLQNPEDKPEYKKYNHPYYWAPFVLVGNWL